MGGFTRPFRKCALNGYKMISSAAGISRLRFVRCAEEEGEGRIIMAEAIKVLNSPVERILCKRQ